MKKIVDIVKLEPQRKFFSATKQKQKYNVKYTKDTDEEKALFMSQNILAEETVDKDVLLRDTNKKELSS